MESVWTTQMESTWTIQMESVWTIQMESVWSTQMGSHLDQVGIGFWTLDFFPGGRLALILNRTQTALGITEAL